jgi:putative PIN family toxin of toxin-antitoxin system
VSRVCLDSNVLVAAFVSRGLCAEVLRVVISDHHLVIPERIRDEVPGVLQKKIKASEEALDAVKAVFARCDIVAVSSTASPISIRDPEDEEIFADGLAAGVQLFITGDADLLSVAAESPIPILSPRAFLTLIRRGTS